MNDKWKIMDNSDKLNYTTKQSGVFRNGCKIKMNDYFKEQRVAATDQRQQRLKGQESFMNDKMDN